MVVSWNSAHGANTGITSRDAVRDLPELCQVDPHGRPIDAKATSVQLNGGGTLPSDRVQLREIVVIDEGLAWHAQAASGSLADLQSRRYKPRNSHFSAL
jgi:hypothetical protein